MSISPECPLKKIVNFVKKVKEIYYYYFSYIRSRASENFIIRMVCDRQN